MKTVRMGTLMRRLATLSTLLFGTLPLIASAQQDIFTTGQSSATKLLGIVQILSTVAFVAILLFFFWGLAIYVYGGAEDHKRGRNIMIWGVVAIFIAASVWGIVQVLRTTFGVGNQQSGFVPFVE